MPMSKLQMVARDWLTAFGSLLPNDRLGCAIRRRIYRAFGMGVGDSTVIYRHVLLLGRIDVGEGSSISNNCCINGGTAGVRIGRHVMIAPNCCLVAFDHGTALNGAPMIEQPLVEAPIVIEDDVWIGANCTITAGVTIRTGAVVAANSVVTHDVGPHQIVGGTPARFIKHRSPAVPHA